MTELACWNCGESLADVPGPITRHSNCPKCFEVLHCCRMCRFYAPGRPQDCEHDRAEPPVEKEGANFCEYFAPALETFQSADGQRKDAAKSKFAALFGEEEANGDHEDVDKDPDDPRSKLDDLFDD